MTLLRAKPQRFPLSQSPRAAFRFSSPIDNQMQRATTPYLHPYLEANADMQTCGVPLGDEKHDGPETPWRTPCASQHILFFHTAYLSMKILARSRSHLAESYHHSSSLPSDLGEQFSGHPAKVCRSVFLSNNLLKTARIEGYLRPLVRLHCSSSPRLASV